MPCRRKGAGAGAGTAARIRRQCCADPLSHHSPTFRILPEPAIATGATAMTAAVLELLAPATS